MKELKEMKRMFLVEFRKELVQYSKLQR